jgi:hypothetical protein
MHTYTVPWLLLFQRVQRTSTTAPLLSSLLIKLPTVVGAFGLEIPKLKVRTSRYRSMHRERPVISLVG